MSKKTLVIGASENEERYSNKAIRSLRSHGHDVVAIGLKKGRVLDVEIDDQLSTFRNVDTVTLYINPKLQDAYFDYICSLKPRRVIFNPGTENPDLVDRLDSCDIASDEACTLVLLSINQY
jgi:uncharacterized protein